MLIQTVEIASDPYFHELLVQVGKDSGIPLLINADLRKSGWPPRSSGTKMMKAPQFKLQFAMYSRLQSDGMLVSSVKEGLHLLRQSEDLDSLVIEGRLFSRVNIVRDVAFRTEMDVPPPYVQRVLDARLTT
eukprot:NODE_14251_length_452_cov_48.176292_g13953_i0.p1 GENE.NODE_14251_length_452_cov_48.176292_g13953_i0~~NODE_14251_length_452_cov_48.176292_g13953_i0.p1  ORF type:complete len:143 (-),score=27.29 NODE_14251_length_452_cov_48.176292_g13953_i0:23-415(-)